MKSENHTIRSLPAFFLCCCLLFLFSGFMTGCSSQGASSGEKQASVSGNQNDLAEESAEADDLSNNSDITFDTEDVSLNSQETPESDSSDIVDLTKLSSTMIYSEVYNMMYEPERYIGKTIIMNGSFAVYDETDKNYYACVVADAAACCSQGIEFELKGNPSYPADYPQVDSNITVEGIFETYEEDGYTYCHLVNAEMTQ